MNALALRTLALRYVNGPLVAWHEAGHTLVAHRLGRRVEKVELSYARDAGRTRFVASIYSAEDRALILAAGVRAERRSISWSDAYAALEGGCDDREGLAWALSELPGVTEAELIERVDDMFLWDHLALERLARRLDDVRVLDGAEVVAILDG